MRDFFSCQFRWVQCVVFPPTLQGKELWHSVTAVTSLKEKHESHWSKTRVPVVTGLTSAIFKHMLWLLWYWLAPGIVLIVSILTLKRDGDSQSALSSKSSINHQFCFVFFNLIGLLSRWNPWIDSNSFGKYFPAQRQWRKSRCLICSFTRGFLKMPRSRPSLSWISSLSLLWAASTGQKRRKPRSSLKTTSLALFY